MTETFTGMGADEARAFAERWLPAWTGNDPERLLSFYAPDAFYRDPTLTDGATGHDELRPYFRVLLGNNPDWVWTQRRSDPMAGGFVNYWHVAAPVGDSVVELDGVCLVQLRDGLIVRNEVWFDPSPLLAAIRAWTARR